MGKIFITGPGRAGTSFLMQLLTRLGADTGLEPYNEPYDPQRRAGCEWELPGFEMDDPEVALARLAASPRVIKGPIWSFYLKWLVGIGLEIDSVILPLRDLDESARSRLSVGLDWLLEDDLKGEERVTAQATIHAAALGRAIEACYIWELPCLIMRFPTLVQDPEYCYTKLSSAFSLKKSAFMEIFRELSNPGQIQTE